MLSPVKPSHNRRCARHDYCAPCIYMITMTKAPGVPDFSEVLPNPLWTPADPVSNQAYTRQSSLGRKILLELSAIQRRNPSLRVYRRAIMPDHIHFLLHIIRHLDEPIGIFLRDFKGRCAAHNDNRPVFTPGFNDRILWHKGQLETFNNYILDNPRRLYLRRAHPEYFSRVCRLEISGREYCAFGNLFLLRNPTRAAVVIRSSFSPEKLQGLYALWEEVSRSEGVLVSPFISQKEKAVREAGLRAGASIIHLLDNGFPPRYKPSGRDFGLCCEGRLLEIAPVEYSSQKKPLRREAALALNDLAMAIAALPAGEALKGRF